MRYTEAPARRAELLRRLNSDGYISSAALADELGVSEMTIRRDLRQLHLEGLARRVAGGASLPAAGMRGTPFEQRDLSAAVEKAALAELCAERLEGARTVALDAGTTVAGVAALLAPGTTVVTHSLPVIRTCTDRDDLSLIALGGTYLPETRAFIGQATRDGLARISVDVAVLSATAVDATGVLCANDVDAEIKQAMRASARSAIVLADSSKIGARAPIRFGTLDSVDVLMTGGALRDDQRRILAGFHDVAYADLDAEAAR